MDWAKIQYSNFSSNSGVMLSNAAFYAKAIEITGNRFTNNSAYPISISYAYNLTISDNYFFGNEMSMYIYGAGILSSYHPRYLL